MAPFVPSYGFGVLTLMLLLLLLQGDTEAVRADAHTLSYNFSIIPRPKPEQPWCAVQCQLEGFVLFQHQCGKQKENLVFLLATKETATSFWKEQTDSLNFLMEELKKKLLDLQPEMVRTSEPLSLQGTMECEEVTNTNRHIHGSWRFEINGHISLHLNTENRHWTVDPADTGMLEMWEEDRELNNLLLKMVNGDCRMWRQQLALLIEKIPDTTASPATAPSTVTAKATTIRHMSWLIPVMFLTCTVLLGILGLY